MSKTTGGYPDLSNNCRPLPPPYILRVARMQMLQEKNKITILYVQDHQVRRVRLNGSHPARPTPTPYGDSVGHYEDGTLVIDTVGIGTGPDSMIDMYGTPHTDALHVIESYRFIDGEAARLAQERSEKEYGRPNTEPIYVDFEYKGKGLEVEFTVVDDGAFTTPWSGSVTYRRAASDWEEIACAENRHEYYGGKDTPVPEAKTLDF
jgi:hypothetical protein